MKSRTQHDYPIEILFDLNPYQIDIPLDWTVEQADELVTIIGHLEERIWTIYGDDLAKLVQAQTQIEPPTDQDLNSTYDPDDDIPF